MKNKTSIVIRNKAEKSLNPKYCLITIISLLEFSLKFKKKLANKIKKDPNGLIKLGSTKIVVLTTSKIWLENEN